ncbi:MAG: hypothetical protein GEV08_23775, partial [Acidimicrobiia bacterium]|nr:hypothetical protein [Acidimicrobiia bacterium]
MDASVVAPGGTVGISGDGFADSATITISLDAEALSTVQATSAGTFSTRVRIPADTPAGTHVLSATGLAADGRSQRTVSANITVSPTGASRTPDASPRPRATLARTGSDSSLPLVQAGAA